jgi:hypothetical protein
MATKRKPKEKPPTLDKFFRAIQEDLLAIRRDMAKAAASQGNCASRRKLANPHARSDVADTGTAGLDLPL